MILNLWKARSAQRSEAEALYRAAVRQTRRPEFYRAGGVADSFEGRFDLLTLHLALVLRRLKGAGAEKKPVAQRLLDLFFADMDDSLRELGVGDMGVGRRVRRLSEAFYGRLEAYDAGLAENDEDTLTRAVARNLYGDETGFRDSAAMMAGYMRETAHHLGRLDPDGLLTDALFPEPPEFREVRTRQTKELT